MSTASYKQWRTVSQNGIVGLELSTAEMPRQLGDEDVLVAIYASSLNYRDLVLVEGANGLTTAPNVVPGSDGAGIVISIGDGVTSHEIGDRVITHLIPGIESSRQPAFADISNGLGQAVDGTLREYGVFNEDDLIPMPKSLTFEQAATLTCSGLTAYNALFGPAGVRNLTGQTVLTMGSGGVSVAALQFAKAAGAKVISTTSSSPKADMLTKLGASHTLLYTTTPSWGSAAKALTPNSHGVDNVIDVGGLSTMSQSMEAVAVGGTVSLTGVLGAEGQDPGLISALWRVCSVRGVFLGTRDMFREMVEFVDKNGIVPYTDEKVFRLEEVKEAYQYLKSGKHFSKVVVKIV